MENNKPVDGSVQRDARKSQVEKAALVKLAVPTYTAFGKRYIFTCKSEKSSLRRTSTVAPVSLIFFKLSGSWKSEVIRITFTPGAMKGK